MYQFLYNVCGRSDLPLY